MSVAKSTPPGRQFVVYHERRHPADLTSEHVRGFLSHLAVARGVAASTQNQELAALTFLYDAVIRRPLKRVEGITPARRSRHVPVVLDPRELRSIMRRLAEPSRLCVCRCTEAAYASASA